MEKQVFDKIEQVLTDILSTHKDIYTEENKTILNNEIRSKSSDNELALNILLTLVVNDVFIFINNKDYQRAERNISNCLGEFNLYQSDYTRLYEILKISNELKKIKRKKKLAKVRNYFIAACILGLCILGYVVNYNSYFRTPTEVFVKATDGENAFFIAKAEAHDSEGMPIVDMSWFDAINYCNELSKQNNLACVYSISEDGIVTADFSMPGYRLPTKKEWIIAALGGKMENSVDYSGAGISNCEKSAWYIMNSAEIVHKVAEKDANGLKLFDMSGNVAEWCWDATDDDCRIVMGGFYGTSKEYLHIYKSEIKHKPNFGEVYIGFRPVRSYVKKNVGAEK